jgi:integrase
MKLLRSISRKGALGASLSPSNARIIIRRYGALIGVPDLNPHDLRRTLAKLSRRGGADLETIQATLGHASIKTTEIYLAAGEHSNAGDYIDV